MVKHGLDALQNVVLHHLRSLGNILPGIFDSGLEPFIGSLHLHPQLIRDKIVLERPLEMRVS